MVRGLMTDREWKFFEPFVVASGGKSGRPPGDHRLVLDGIFWIARTGAQWRDLHEYFGKWSSVYRQFRRWTLAGVWELMLEALNEGGGALESVQMIDSTIIRAHHQAAGAIKGDSKAGFWAFKRWLYDKGSSPHQWRRAPDRDGNHRRRSLRLQRLRRRDERRGARAQSVDRRQGL